MGIPAYVRHATLAAGSDFIRYPSVQIDLGTGTDRALVVFVRTDSGDAANAFAACVAGASGSGSQAGGTTMTNAAAAFVDNSARQWGRAYVLTGASLPEGTQWIVGDAGHADRKPGILAILYEDSGNAITASAGVNLNAEATTHTWTLPSTTGSNERAVLGCSSFGATLTPTSPLTESSADGNPLMEVYERDGAASSTACTLTSSLDYVMGTAVMLTGGAGDTTAPTLTSPTATSTGSTTATVGATTDEGNGTMYAVVTTSATQPTVAQIKAGQNDAGAAAPWGGSVSVTSTGAKTLNATGLVFGTVYYAHVVHTDAASNNSNRVSSASFDAVIRPNSDSSVTGWTSTAATVYEVLDEATPSDADFATSPTITGVGQKAIVGLKNGPLAAGTWSPAVRAAVSSGQSTLRIALVNNSNDVQGQVDISVTATPTRYDPTITTTGEATRLSFEFFS